MVILTGNTLSEKANPKSSKSGASAAFQKNLVKLITQTSKGTSYRKRKYSLHKHVMN